MPLVACKRPRSRSESGEKESHDTCSAAKRPKTTKTKFFTEFSTLDYKESHWHTLVRSLPESEIELHKMLAKYIGSLLNGSGGILCFGARKTGMVYGDRISRREEDNLKLVIDDVMKKFRPIVSPQMYRVTFTPVTRRNQPSLMLLEIRVSPGDPYELYESEFHEVYLRKGSEPYGPLTPHEIKRHVVQQMRKKLLMGTVLLHKALDQEEPILPQERRPVKKNVFYPNNDVSAQVKRNSLKSIRKHPLEETRSAAESLKSQNLAKSTPNTGPVKSKTTPNKSNSVAGKSSTAPVKSNTTPNTVTGKSGAVPVKSYTTPNKSNAVAPAGQSIAAPVKSNVTQNQANSVTGKSGTLPAKSNTTPDKSNTVTGQSTTVPVKSTVVTTEYISCVRTPFGRTIVPAKSAVIIPNTPPPKIVPPIKINMPPTKPLVPPPPAWTTTMRRRVLRNPYQQPTSSGYYPQPLPLPQPLHRPQPPHQPQPLPLHQPQPFPLPLPLPLPQPLPQSLPQPQWHGNYPWCSMAYRYYI